MSIGGRCLKHDNWHAHCQQCCREQKDALRTQRDALAEALRGLMDDGCWCAVNEREEPCESCARARAALAKLKEET